MVVVLGLSEAPQVEIEAMELQPLDQVAATFWLEGRQGRIAQFLICFPIGRGNALQQLLGQIQQFVFARIAHRCSPFGHLRIFNSAQLLAALVALATAG